MIILLHSISQLVTPYALTLWRFDTLTLWHFVWISLGSETIPEDLERESGRIWALPEPLYAAAAPLHVAPGFLVDRSSRQRFGAGAWRSSKRRQEDRGGTPVLTGVRHCCLNRTFRYQHERNIKKQIKCSIWIKFEFLGRPPWWAAVSLGDFRTRGHWQERVVTVVTWRYLTCNCCISWCNLYIWSVCFDNIHPDPIGDPTLSQDGSPYLASDLTELISAGASGEVPGNAVGWMSTCEKLWKVGTKRADAWLAGSAGSSGIRNQT